MPFRSEYDQNYSANELNRCEVEVPESYQAQLNAEAKKFEEEHFLVIPERACEQCGKKKKLKKQFWHVDSAADDGFKKVCKTCRNKLPIDYEVDRERLDESENTLTAPERKRHAEQLINNSRQNKVPHIAELYEQLIDRFDGADGIARKYRDTYDEAMPGGSVRKGILDRIVATGEKVTDMGDATVPLDMIANRDLQALAMEQIKKLTQSGQINATLVQSMFADGNQSEIVDAVSDADVDADVDTGIDPIEGA